MYSRQSDRSIRIPHNYGGNIFRESAQTPTPVEDRTRRRPNTFGQAANGYSATDSLGAENGEKTVYEAAETEKDGDTEAPQITEEVNAGAPILSPFGVLGTEEILLIALALIIFQGGKEPEPALMLLALLFIN